MIVADMDYTPHASPTINKMIEDKNEIDFFIHMGDFAYEIYDENGLKGDTFWSLQKDAISSKPYIVTPGNHENIDNTKFMNYRFRMPGGNDDINTRNNWYSFTVNNIHFVSINTDWY